MLLTYGLRTLRTKLSFKQLRFFCHKKIPGRTFDIATTTNTSGQHVVEYFTTQRNVTPESCGSYYPLSDDNSILAGNCALWGRGEVWSRESVPTANRLFDHAAYIARVANWFVHQPYGRWECDDFYKAGCIVSSGDFWKIFVR